MILWTSFDLNLGNRSLVAKHTRLRLGASPLNSHLFKIGINESPACSCGSPNEDNYHYFFSCPKFNIPRPQLHSKIAHLAPFTLQTLLHGSRDCSFLENSDIFSTIHEFMLLIALSLLVLVKFISNLSLPQLTI